MLTFGDGMIVRRASGDAHGTKLGTCRMRARGLNRFAILKEKAKEKKRESYYSLLLLGLSNLLSK